MFWKYGTAVRIVVVILEMMLVDNIWRKRCNTWRGWTFKGYHTKEIHMLAPCKEVLPYSLRTRIRHDQVSLYFMILIY
jgi:hypothetical protein